MTDATTTPTDKAGPMAWLLMHPTEPNSVEMANGDRDPITDADRKAGWSSYPLYTHPQPSLSVGLDREAVFGVVRQYAAPAWCSVDRLTDAILALYATAPTAGSGWVDAARQALADADDVSNRIHKGGYRANLSDVECLRNHVRKLVKLAAPSAVEVECDGCDTSGRCTYVGSVCALPAAPTVGDE